MFTLLLALWLGLTLAKEYNLRDKVEVMVNTVGPFHNPAETYQFYTLPFCAPAKTKADEENLGGTLIGDRPKTSLYEIRFKVKNEWQFLCSRKLTQNAIHKFRKAIKENYLFELFVDDLSVKGFVGEAEVTSVEYVNHAHNETTFYLFNHIDFSIAYNGPHVIAVNMTTDPRSRIPLEFGEDLETEFSYSVSWVETNVAYIDRMFLHSKSFISSQSLEIHWLSIVNSFVLVVLLTLFSAVVLMRVLKKDFARYMEIDDDDLEEGEEGGWKLVHTDVFRSPRWIMLLSSFVGTGTQILVLAVTILFLSLVGTFYPGNRGALYTAAIFFYSMTAGIAGNVSTSMYLSLGGTRWATNAVLTACIFALPLLLCFSVLNSIAIHYGSSTALPFGTIFFLVLVWALVTFPLTIIGAFRAKQNAKPFEPPCKPRPAQREIPSVPWYRAPIVHCFIAGFLPFSSIYIELHYIFVSIWGHRVYTLFGILCLAFIMLLIVTAFITVTLTYFQLAAQDYHWWWRSFISGCTSGVFMYMYAIFYFVYRSQMSGLLQTAFFFGYALMMSYAFALMLGAVAYHVAIRFVIHIYRAIKVE